MKNRIILFIACLFCFSASGIAQEKVKLQVSKLVQKDQTIELTIVSSKPFYMGNNIHVLHIGKSDFKLSRQSKENGKGTLTFLIPVTDFNNLNDGDKMWLTYGDKIKNNSDKENDLNTLSEKSSKTCWKLGKLSKQILTK